MRRALLGLGLILTVGTSLLAQRAPDFSGTWVMQPTARPGGNSMTAGGGGGATGGRGGSAMAGSGGAASTTGSSTAGSACW